MKKTLIYFVVVMLSIACSRSPTRSAEVDLKILTETDSALQQAVAQRDLEKIMLFYADDATLLPTAEPPVHGKDAIRKEWGHILAIPDFENKSTMTKLEVASGGDMAYTTGTYLAKMMGENGKPATEPGKWVSIWKKQPDGKWRIAVDIYNTDVPPPDHK